MKGKQLKKKKRNQAKRGKVSEVWTAPGATSTRAVKADLAWFLSHPGIRKRLRPMIPGELDEYPMPEGITRESITHILVMRVGDMYNARIPLTEEQAKEAENEP